jgi:ribosomal protein S27AE
MSATMICPSCGTQGKPKNHTRGSIWIEIVLWLCLIVPGLIYSLWRLTTKQKVCPACGAAGMIPLSSPRGAVLVKQFSPR